MSLHKLSAGDGYIYLTRQVAAGDSTERGRTSLADYYAEKGETPGRWVGAGLAGLGMTPGEVVGEDQMVFLFGEGRHPDTGEPLGRPFPVYDSSSSYRAQVAAALAEHNAAGGRAAHAPVVADERAEIRSQVATRMFADKHGRAPTDARELSGFIAQVSRQPSAAVAGYDLTFSPVKSVSTLWALAPLQMAQQVQAAHRAAVEDTVVWLERDVAFTRVGSGGVRQVAVRGLVAATFTHRDSRAGDPDLHTHVAVSNKVQTDDGRWFALDGRVLYGAAVTASERYNTRLEAELVARLGVRFADRSDGGDGKRPVREIVGIHDWLNRHWSSRRRDIDERRSQLASGFQDRHGRPPTPAETVSLAQQATLETRDAKHAPRSEADQRAQWRKEAARVVYGEAEVDAMVANTLGHRPRSAEVTDGWVADCAETVVAVLEERRATWRVWHVRAEAERQARAAGVSRVDLDRAVDRIVYHALNGLSVRLGAPDPVEEPAELRRADGVSVYTVHGATDYTSPRVLAAEQRLLSVAGEKGGRSVDAVRVGVAVAEEAANGITLNPAQAVMVHDLATSGARLRLTLAPAGTGKTTALRVLARAWTDDGGYLLGLAPSAQAAHELGHALTGRTETLAKLTWTLTHQPPSAWSGWMHRIGPRTLVVVDEAGQAATTDLATAVEFVVGRGGSVRLVGDDQQLAAVGAGGILRDIARTEGAVTLDQVRRFDDPAEAAATLALRDGDPTALGFYADNNRIHVGDLGTVTDHAYQAWAANRAAGLDSVLLAPTRDLVTRLNEQARTDRHATIGRPRGREARLGDGTHASSGDTVLTRRNDRRLVCSTSNWVTNGDRWTVEQVHPDGSMKVRHLDHHRSLTLPAGYVGEHVQLGYAATIHTAQGITCDTAHVVVTGDEPRQLLYVALSRGRRANHVYLGHGTDGEVGSLLRPESQRPPTAVEVLTGILQRDGSQQSATTTRHDLDSPATQLCEAVARYRDALGYAAEHVLGAETLTRLGWQIEAVWPGLTTEPAHPTLRSHLALLALDGADPVQLLADAAASGGLATAHDRAAVLDWRLHTGEAVGPLPWLPAIPPVLAEHPDWATYLDARAHRVTDLAHQVHHDATTSTPLNAPAWATRLAADADTELRGDVAVWRAAYGVPAGDERPTGTPQPGVDAAAHQDHLQARIRRATDGEDTAAATWRTMLPETVRSDTYVANLERRLTTLHNADVDPARLIADALAEPRPLPVEHPAAALWWRITRHVDPAALRTADSSAPADEHQGAQSRLTAQLTHAVPGIDTNPHWPKLLDTLKHAHADGYDIPKLLTRALNPSSELNQRTVAADLRYEILSTTDPDLHWRILDATYPNPRQTPPRDAPRPATQHEARHHAYDIPTLRPPSLEVPSR